jgi:hypothetical protein
MDAVRGVPEDCDQAVHKYGAGTTGGRNKEMRQINEFSTRASKLGRLLFSLDPAPLKPR